MFFWSVSGLIAVGFCVKFTWFLWNMNKIFDINWRLVIKFIAFRKLSKSIHFDSGLRVFD